MWLTTFAACLAALWAMYRDLQQTKAEARTEVQQARAEVQAIRWEVQKYREEMGYLDVADPKKDLRAVSGRWRTTGGRGEFTCHKRRNSSFACRPRVSRQWAFRLRKVGQLIILERISLTHPWNNRKTARGTSASRSSTTSANRWKQYRLITVIAKVAASSFNHFNQSRYPIRDRDWYCCDCGKAS